MLAFNEFMRLPFSNDRPLERIKESIEEAKKANVLRSLLAATNPKGFNILLNATRSLSPTDAAQRRERIGKERAAIVDEVLKAAMSLGDKEFLYDLLRQQAKADSEAFSALHNAVRGRDLRMAKMLLNAAEWAGHVTDIVNGPLESVEPYCPLLLCIKMASINAMHERSVAGIEEEYLEIYRLLREKGADPTPVLKVIDDMACSHNRHLYLLGTKLKRLEEVLIKAQEIKNRLLVSDMGSAAPLHRLNAHAAEWIPSSSTSANGGAGAVGKFREEFLLIIKAVESEDVEGIEHLLNKVKDNVTEVLSTTDVLGRNALRIAIDLMTQEGTNKLKIRQIIDLILYFVMAKNASSCLDQSDHLGESPLTAAKKYGFKEVEMSILAIKNTLHLERKIAALEEGINEQYLCGAIRDGQECSEIVETVARLPLEGREKLKRMLLYYDPIANSTPLSCAIERGDVAIVKYLLEVAERMGRECLEGILEYRDNRGAHIFALHRAVKKGYPEIVILILEAVKKINCLVEHLEQMRTRKPPPFLIALKAASKNGAEAINGLKIAIEILKAALAYDRGNIAEKSLFEGLIAQERSGDLSLTAFYHKQYCPLRERMQKGDRGGMGLDRWMLMKELARFYIEGEKRKKPGGDSQAMAAGGGRMSSTATALRDHSLEERSSSSREAASPLSLEK